MTKTRGSNCHFLQKATQFEPQTLPRTVADVKKLVKLFTLALPQTNRRLALPVTSVT
jgi:hypothetical protein